MTRLLLEFAAVATLALLALLGGLALLGRADPPQQLPLVKAAFARGVGVSDAPYQNCAAPGVPHFIVHTQAKRIA